LAIQFGLPAFTISRMNIPAVLLIVSSVPFFPQTSSRQKSHQRTFETYEDDEVRIPIPQGWTRISEKNLVSERSISRAQLGPGTLILRKNGFVLTLGYRADHASGITGGRFTEAFDYPWLDFEGPWDPCSPHLVEYPQPVSRTLLFDNLTLNTADVKTRADCGIAVMLESSTAKGSTALRWYAGEFTDGTGSVFFDDADEACGCKLYTLTPSATKPEQLPSTSDVNLQRIIHESIDIVNSIHYKRCAPTRRYPFL
jgi:hypothetical protein